MKPIFVLLAGCPIILFPIHKFQKRRDIINQIFSKFILIFLLVILFLNQNIAEGVPGTSSFFFSHSFRFSHVIFFSQGEIQAKRFDNRTLEDWQGMIKRIDPSLTDSVQYIPGLLQIIKDSSAPNKTRAQAAYLIARMGKKAKHTVPIFIQLLNQEKGSDSLFWILKSFEIFGKDALLAGEPVQKIAVSDQIKLPLRKAGLEALIKIGPEYSGTIPTLIKILSAPSPDVSPKIQSEIKYSEKVELATQAAQGIGYSGVNASATFPFVLRQAEHPNELLRMECVNAIASMDSRAEPAVPLLLALISNDKSPAVRDAAGKALGKIGSPSIPGLISLLDDSSVETRIHALEAIKLTRTKSKTVREKLLKKLEDKEPLVRIKSASLIWVLFRDSVPILPVLIDEITNKNRDVRSATVQLITRMGKSASDLVPLLEILLEDSRPHVRMTVKKAINVIQKPVKE